MSHQTYTGVGSRTTPAAILRLMTRIALHLGQQGYALRTGDAKGADAAFVRGAKLAGKHGPSVYTAEDATPQALAIAEKHHPAWHKCSARAKLLHARNSFQVLGPFLNDPSEFLICWTPNGEGGGGTGQAIRLAKAHGVRVYDLGNPKVEAAFRRRLDQVATT